jgi:hypothetical protein
MLKTETIDVGAAGSTPSRFIALLSAGHHRDQKTGKVAILHFSGKST